MDFDLPEELADYLPKQRQGFQLIDQHRPPKTVPKKAQTKSSSNPASKKVQTQVPPSQAPRKVQTKSPSNLAPKKVQTKAPSNQAAKRVQTKAPSNVSPKKTTTKPSTETTYVSTNDKTIKTEIVTTSKGSTQKVKTIYPNKQGKILSKVPENKWKEVRSGPREDPTIVRTKEEEIQIFLKYTNDYRIKNHLNALELNEELSQLADVHNNDMMEGKTKVGHEGFKDRCNQIGRKFYQASENCAMYVGPREHLLTLFENLCKSPVHNKNLLGNFDTIGIALGKNSENMWFVTQFFVRFNKNC